MTRSSNGGGSKIEVLRAELVRAEQEVGRLEKEIDGAREALKTLGSEAKGQDEKVQNSDKKLAQCQDELRELEAAKPDLTSETIAAFRNVLSIVATGVSDGPNAGGKPRAWWQAINQLRNGGDVTDQDLAKVASLGSWDSTLSENILVLQHIAAACGWDGLEPKDALSKFGAVTVPRPKEKYYVLVEDNFVSMVECDPILTNVDARKLGEAACTYVRKMHELQRTLRGISFKTRWSRDRGELLDQARRNQRNLNEQVQCATNNLETLDKELTQARARKVALEEELQSLQDPHRSRNMPSSTAPCETESKFQLPSTRLGVARVLRSSMWKKPLTLILLLFCAVLVFAGLWQRSRIKISPAVDTAAPGQGSATAATAPASASSSAAPPNAPTRCDERVTSVRRPHAQHLDEVPCDKPPSSVESACKDPVPLVSFDHSDDQAYDAVACEFWEKFRIRIKRVSCGEEPFDIRDMRLAEYPGGVFTWAPGHPSAKSGSPKLHLTAAGLQVKAGNDDMNWPPVQLLLDRTEHDFRYTPFKFYPWAFYYHKETIKRLNLTFLRAIPADPKSPGANKQKSDVWKFPETWDQLLQTAREMQEHGISPAFSLGARDRVDDRGIKTKVDDAWTAIGTFDVLHIRLRGYEEHEQVMRNIEDWKIARSGVEEVFSEWAKLAKYYSDDWSTATVEESAKNLRDGKVGMYFIGAFFLKHVKGSADDFGLFDFPTIGHDKNPKTYGAIYAPIDSIVLSPSEDKKAVECAEQLLRFLGTSVAFRTYNGLNGLYLSVKNRWVTENQQAGGDTPQHQAARLMVGNPSIADFSARRILTKEVLDSLRRFLTTVKSPHSEDQLKKSINEVVDKIQIGITPLTVPMVTQ